MVSSKINRLSPQIRYEYGQRDTSANRTWPGWVRAIVIVGLSAALWGLIIAAFLI